MSNATKVAGAKSTTIAASGKPIPTVRGGARSDFLRRVRGDRAALISLTVLLLVIVLAILAPYITPQDPIAQDLKSVLRPPGTDGHLLGTDQLGRDILSRLMIGTTTSMLAVLLALAVALVIGLPIGFASGYFGGWVDTILMRVTDAAMSFPPLLLAIALVGILGPNLTNAMIAVGILMSPRFARLMRGVVMGIKEETFIEAARSIGTPTWRIIVRHIVPNAMSPLTVAIAVTSGGAMLSEAGLSFLGLGVQPPDASWGTMIRDGFLYFRQSPWLGVFPGIMISLTVFTFITLGDSLRDALGREERKE